jgi:cytochrome c oxidase subunit 2
MIERLIPAAASSHATSFDAVLMSVHVHIVLIFAAWLAVFVYALIRFRKRANPEPRSEGARGFWPVVAIGAVIVGDVLILAMLALPAWSEQNQPPRLAIPLRLRVTAEQFAWNIHYPGIDGVFGRTDQSLISATNPLGIDRSDGAARDDIGLQNILMLPLYRTVVIDLTSRDVIHSFTLNEMRVKQDANPGMTTRLWFIPTQIGAWDIACSQLCGLGHYRMRGEYQVVTTEDWVRWQAIEIVKNIR